MEIQPIENYLNFSSKYNRNLRKFLEAKWFFISNTFEPYFIWNFWSLVGPTFDQNISSLFKFYLNK
jgi:predicted branched-subunit amino acid permease